MVAMVAMVAVACSIGGGGGGVATTDHTGVYGGKAWCGWWRAQALALVVSRDAQLVEAVSIGGVGDVAVGTGGTVQALCGGGGGGVVWWRLGGGHGFVGSAVCGRSGGGGGTDCCV